MLGFIRGLFSRASRREIFAYHDGERKRYADPLVITRDLDNHEKFNADTHLKGIEHGDDEAFAITLEAIREVFGLKPWTEETPDRLTQRETIDLLADFYDYTDSLKKNIERSQTSPASSDATPSESSEPITSGIAPSTTSEPEPNTAEPT